MNLAWQRQWSDSTFRCEYTAWEHSPSMLTVIRLQKQVFLGSLYWRIPPVLLRTLRNAPNFARHAENTRITPVTAKIVQSTTGRSADICSVLQQPCTFRATTLKLRYNSPKPRFLEVPRAEKTLPLWRSPWSSTM